MTELEKKILLKKLKKIRSVKTPPSEWANIIIKLHFNADHLKKYINTIRNIRSEIHALTLSEVKEYITYE